MSRIKKENYAGLGWAVAVSCEVMGDAVMCDGRSSILPLIFDKKLIFIGLHRMERKQGR